MGKAVRDHVAGTLPLEPVVANGLRRIQGLFQIAHFHDALPFHGMAPYAGEAVGLQLEFYGKLVAFPLRRRLPQLVHLPLDTQKMLHMVSHFMGDDIALGKISAPAQFVSHILEKREIEIHALVGGTVEWPHRRLAVAAGGWRGATVEHQFRWRV